MLESPIEPTDTGKLPLIDLGTMPYELAYQTQCDHHEEVLASRGSGLGELGRILIVEHPPVITVTRRPSASEHVTASADLLNRMGVELHATDRGGDVTYHGPGQLVCYPIIDLNACKLRLHDYIRLLEQSVIDSLAHYGIAGQREQGATGVWAPMDQSAGGELAKVCAIGVRIRRWITLHGLAVNIAPNMDHFQLIVPCGLAGRPVQSVKQLIGDECPSTLEFAEVLSSNLRSLIFKNIDTKTESSS
ncbi:MAG: lipoyl(octanoyl) transferase LipB [Phycisphaerales bacterium]